MALILVADDDDALATLLREYLVKSKHEVVVAFDGESAMKAARERRPDLMILDLNMPGLKGSDAFRGLDEDQTRKTPVIFISGLAPEEARRLAFLPLWANGRLLPKPVELAKLDALIAELLKSK